MFKGEFMNLFRTLAIAALGVFVSFSACALEFWHTETNWAGGGMCAAAFSFDSGGLDEYKDVSIELVGVDIKGVPALTASIYLDSIGESNAERFASEFVESSEICDSDLILHVVSASAVKNGTPTNLLDSGDLTVRELKPMTIVIPAPKY